MNKQGHFYYANFETYLDGAFFQISYIEICLK